ncbi:hypothetical protein DOTSEDRAFT_45297 [Dothistroma septosporum NZE10]|uniref:Uncharacterized protein n=1 Tax=Dothistroma septosporum (strain NZE10 / CBS 128990) TaxID=675120 RepID=M2XLK8_DOTSN|nr:hypothetical protein DOTSEDRAFT_45297 [Dothistroma septosporum NZE10]
MAPAFTFGRCPAPYASLASMIPAILPFGFDLLLGSPDQDSVGRSAESASPICEAIVHGCNFSPVSWNRFRCNSSSLGSVFDLQAT